MTYEEWYEITSVMAKFQQLDETEKDQILLMIDGLKFRACKLPLPPSEQKENV